MVAVGLPFTHRIEALSVARGSGQGSDLDPLYRPVRLTFRVLDTAHLEADAGRGLERLVDRDAATGPLSGDIRQRAYGWRRGFAAAPWKIVQREPKAFSLLCVTTEMKVNS